MLQKGNSRTFVAIDPGYNGGIAVFSNNKLIKVTKMPVIKAGGKTKLDEVAIRKLFELVRPAHVFIEKAQPYPRQGVVSTANYMLAYGMIIGIVVGMKIPYTLVPPQQWKKNVVGNLKGVKDKGMSILRAKQLFPDIELKRNDDGPAEAALIGYYKIHRH